ncbi:MAG: T9SS type A sorting domain-containing protein [Bacteroidota bacterium]
MKNIYLLCLLLVLHTSIQAQSIIVSGECITGNITLTALGELENSKIAYQGTGTVSGVTGVTVTVSWIGTPDNVWVLSFDGQPYFQNSCSSELPPSSPNVACPWTAVSETSCSGSTGLTVQGAGVLAVSITSFTGTKSNGNVLLNWKTASELKNKEFEVQRSTEGIHWQAIGTVPGAMSSNTELRYHFTDKMPLIGKNYYRLLQKDVDGRSSYSGVVVLEMSGNSFKVNNTPAAGIFQLLVQSDETTELSLYDAAGRKTWSLRAGTGIHRLDLTGQPAGVYLLQIKMKNEVRSQKIINP